MHPEMISTKDLEGLIGKNDVLIVDLRLPQAYQMQHVYGAVNIPYNEIGKRRLPKAKMIILYCSRGCTSLMICRKLRKQGIDAVSVNGGFHAYTGKISSNN